MKKINIKYEIISDEKNVSKSKGILKNNEIIFYDGKVKNKIKIFDNKIILERQLDYFLKLEFIMGKKTNGMYNTKELSYDIDIFTNFLEIKENEIIIDYYLNNDKTHQFKVKISYYEYE